MKQFRWTASFRITLLAVLLAAAGAAGAQTVERERLLGLLQEGGLVIVLNQAHSHRSPPEADEVRAGNEDRARQLSERGMEEARTIGQALRQLDIPVGEALVSPTYRTLEMARVMNLDDFESDPRLGREGNDYIEETTSQYLRELVNDPPEQGNRIIITHYPNINRAFDFQAPQPDPAEAWIFDPDRTARPVRGILGRIRENQWQNLIELHENGGLLN